MVLVRRYFGTATAWCAACIALGGAVAGACAETLTVAGFLRTAKKGFTLEAQVAKASYLRDAPGNAPLIQNAELRVHNTAFDPLRQEYALRLSPRGLGESAAGARLRAALQVLHDDRRELLLNGLLRERYELVVDLLYRRELLGLQEQLKGLYEDRITVLNHKVAEANFDLATLIEAERDYTGLLLDIISTRNRIATTQRAMREYMPGSGEIVLDTAGLVGVAAIESTLAAVPFSLDTDNVYLRNSRLALEAERRRCDLENAQGRQVVSFVEFSFDHGELRDQLAAKRRYEADLAAWRTAHHGSSEGFEVKPRHEYDLNEAYGLRLGVNIPCIGRDRLDLARRRLALLSEQGRHEDLKKELNARLRQYTEEMKTLVQQYRLLEKRGREIDTESSLKKYLQVDGIDPLVLLKTRESIIKSNRDLARIRLDLYQKYIGVLDITGALARKPPLNLLSVLREPLEP